jgi:hypothetical protein
MSSITAGTTSTTTLVHSGDTTGSLVFKTNDTGSGGTTAVTIDTSQNVGIGNTTPSSYNSNANKLVIGSNSAVTGMTLASGTTAAGNIFFARGTTGADAYDGYVQYAQNGQYMAFGTSGGAERMRILSGGNVSIGTTSNIARLGAVFDGATDNGCVLRTSTNASGTGFLYFQENGNTCGSVIRIGTTSAVTYSTTSDYRLKENITPMTGALSKVARLKPVTYTWKSGGESAEGFIAHELAEVCPDAVVGTKDELDKDGNPKYQSIDTSFLVATLTAALQETKALIDQQAETINALTARVVALEGK